MSEHQNQSNELLASASYFEENHDSPLLQEVPVDILPNLPPEVPENIRHAIMDERRTRAREGAEATKVIVGQREAIEHAKIDPVTGLHNRTAFEEDYPRIFRRITNGQLGVFVIDLNGLNRMNNTKGHEAGDEYLRKVADIITECIRANDRAYRVGGDELAVLVDGQNLKGAYLFEVMKLISGRIKGKVGMELGEDFEKLHLGLSIGGAVKSEQQESAKDLIKLADEAQMADKNQFYDELKERTGIDYRRK